MNYTGPKVRRSRRVGVALTPKAQKVMDRKPQGPGQDPRGRRRQKISDYGRQLTEKQKLRFQYNVAERQMRRYIAEANRKAGNTADNLMQLLESRLDSVVLRSGFAPTIYAARQLVTHGHFQIGGRRVNIPSYQVRPGEAIEVKEKSRQMPLIRKSLSDVRVPPYIQVDRDNLRASLLAYPGRTEIPVICEVPLVIEFYSR